MKSPATLVATLDFEVVLIDGRTNILDGCKHRGRCAEERTLHEGTIRYVNEEPDEAISSLNWDSKTYAIIATHSHPLDREILRLSLRQPFQYCGMIGSKRKVIVTRKLFLERGWATEDDLDRIDMPIGIDIDASSPAEIAVSIAARMIEVKNRKEKHREAHGMIGASPRMLHPSSLLDTIHSLNTDCTNDLACATATL